MVVTEPTTPVVSNWARFGPLLGYIGLALTFHLAFGSLYPTSQGGLGHDYLFMLPALLAGRYWLATNGLSAVPWFTPAFCGGQPLLADPQSFYYSIPQFLTLAMSPLAAVYSTVLLFATLGYWGTYLLLRQSFLSSRAASMVAAGLFMMNGFFAYRMAIGHFTFHAFMLTPWVARLVLGPARPRTTLQSVRAGVLAGLCGAYWIYSGMINLIIPASLAVLAVVFLQRLNGPSQGGWSRILLRCAIGCAAMIGVGAMKLVAAQSYMAAFPRSGYSLPGMDSIWDVLQFAFKSLFISPSNIKDEVQDALANVQWALDRHELEYGITVVALALLLWGAFVLTSRLVHRPWQEFRVPRFGSRVWVAIVGLVVILGLPIILNLYSPHWNDLLKRVPIIQSSSNLFRWFIIDIVVATAAAGLAFDTIQPSVRPRLAGLALLLLALMTLSADHAYYESEKYRPDVIQAGYAALASGLPVPPIQGVRLKLRDPSSGSFSASPFVNDQLVEGQSALECYNPIFGYHLEDSPVKTLHAGSPLDAENGALNFKNPACYVWPKANACLPGDQFRSDQEEALRRLLQYRPFDFQISLAQRIANTITAACLALSALVLLFSGVRLTRRAV